MAGELVKTEAICLDIRPWSRTSHVVSWLTSTGRVVTIVKGAVRPKSQFLGQYDFNYTCDILYYARAKGEVHALREATPTNFRESLRGDFRALALAGYFRLLAAELSPVGPEAGDWYALLSNSLDELVEAVDGGENDDGWYLRHLLAYELQTLDLLGLKPEIAPEGGEITLRGERKLVIGAEIARTIANPATEKKLSILLDTARSIGVYYKFHVDCASEVRRMVLTTISKTKE